ncbi:DUF4251 domain-containing protein [Maribacter sp. 4G9]|uniref:DUF4251 domain-containing protein n=1 Tax=Maribacter sp. 4G9 TaxID=1889777 RepID=UPI000C15601E|nr:DUF4251 domain-containing protein [Maribacter sp. 4G9]PIB25755.1 hypothetical protein BFP75_08970 [Maribacter sp. 4G9]
MKIPYHFLWIITLLLLIGCKSTSKVAYTPEGIASFRDLIDKKSFKFIAETANPTMTNGMNALANAGLWPPGSTVSNIMLQGNNDYLEVHGDSISADLPYFGERQMGGGYDSNTGISFKGIPSHYKEEYDASKNEMRITFTITENLESYRVTLSAFPNKRATVIINSAQRFPIRYLGEITEIEDSDKSS